MTSAPRLLIIGGRPLAPVLSAIAQGPHVIQVAALSHGRRAQALARLLGGWVFGDAGVYRVRLGPYRDARDAERARDAVVVRGYGDAVIRSTTSSADRHP